MSQYTPTTEPWLKSADAETQAEWDAWIVEHDRQVAAQAFEQAAEKYRDQWVGLAGGVPEWLRARAVEIREGRQ